MLTQRVPTPYALTRSFKILKPFLPCVCIVVLRVSTAVQCQSYSSQAIAEDLLGTRIMRNRAPAKEAKAVLSGLGNFERKGLDDNRARMPALAAVSPKRAAMMG